MEQDRVVPGSCPAVDSTGYESNSDESINVDVTSCGKRLRAGNATTN